MKISAHTTDAPGRNGPQAPAEFDTAPYIARLLASGEFRMDMVGDLGPVLLATLESGDVAPLLAAIEAEAHERLADYIESPPADDMNAAEAAEAYCRLFERVDAIRRARAAA